MSFPDFRLLVLFSLDLSPRLTTDTSVDLDGPLVPLPGVKLSHGTFFVLSPVENGPGDFSWVLLLSEEPFGFSIDQNDPLTVVPDKVFPVAGVDFHSRELAKLGPHTGSEKYFWSVWLRVGLDFRVIWKENWQKIAAHADKKVKFT